MESQFAGPTSSITTNYSACKSGEPRMAQIAFLWPPCDLIVMAGAAEFSILDIRHVYIARSGAHPETDFSMAYIAFEADTMKPV